MSLLAFHGFETGDLKRCAATAGTVTADSAVKRTGGYSLKVVGTGADQNFVTIKGDREASSWPDLAADTLYLTGWLRIATAPASGSENILALRTTSGAPIVYLRLSSARVLSIYDGSGTLVAAGSTALATDTWHRVQLYASAYDAARLYANGTLEASGTSDWGESFCDQIILGNSASAGNQAFTIYWDDVLADNGAFHGDVAVLRLGPSGDGTYTAWTNTYTSLDEVPFGTDYVYSSAVDQQESVALTDAAAAGIPSTATILGVALVAVACRFGTGGAGNPRWSFHGLSNGVSNLRFDDVGAVSTSAWEMRSRIAELDWNGNVPWTAAALDTLQVVIKDRRDSETAALRCNILMAEVAYRTDLESAGEATGAGSSNAQAATAHSASTEATGQASAVATPAVTSVGSVIASGRGESALAAVLTSVASARCTGRAEALLAAAVAAAARAVATGRGLAGSAVSLLSEASGEATGRGFTACALLPLVDEILARHWRSRRLEPVHAGSCGTAWRHLAVRATPVSHHASRSARRENDG